MTNYLSRADLKAMRENLERGITPSAAEAQGLLDEIDRLAQIIETDRRNAAMDEVFRRKNG